MVEEEMNEERSSVAGDSRRRNLWLGVVGALLVAVVAVYVWKLVAVSDVRREARVARDSLHQRALLAIDDRTADLLRLSVVPLGWAIRTEMLRRNYEQADAFLTELVQEPGVEGAVLAVPRDSILLATDRRLEGRRFSSVFSAGLLQLTEPAVTLRDDGTYEVAVPMLGPTRSLGVLVLTYRPPEVDLPSPGDDPSGVPSRSPPSGEGDSPEPADTAANTLPEQEMSP